jgi:hypothetical protein
VSKEGQKVIKSGREGNNDPLMMHEQTQARQACIMLRAKGITQHHSTKPSQMPSATQTGRQLQRTKRRQLTFELVVVAAVDHQEVAQLLWARRDDGHARKSVAETVRSGQANEAEDRPRQNHNANQNSRHLTRCAF